MLNKNLTYLKYRLKISNQISNNSFKKKEKV